MLIDDDVFDVLTTTSDTHLSGQDFDNRIIDSMTEGYPKKTGTDVSKDCRALGKLKRGPSALFPPRCPPGP